MNILKLWPVLLGTFFIVTTTSAATNQDTEEDSVMIWGPWETLGTAAGPGEQTRALSFRYIDSNNFTDSDDFVADLPDGNQRFYGVIHNGMDYRGQGCKFCDGPLGLLSMGPYFNGERIVSADISYGESGISFDFTGDDGLSHSANMSFHSTRGADPFMRYRYGDMYSWRGTNCTGSDCARIKELGDDYFRGFTQTSEMMDYLQQRDYGVSFITSDFVAGTTSSISAINALQSLAGDTTAHYYGSLFHAGPVSLHINLSNATWNGYFGTPIGTAMVSNGSINGADLAGTVTGNVPSITDNGPNTLTGTVEASFFGSQAETIAGVIDTTNQIDRYVDVFKSDLCERCGDN